jgi:hypothetical protein
MEKEITIKGRTTGLLFLFILVCFSVKAQEKCFYIILHKGSAKSVADKTKTVTDIQAGRREILSFDASLTLSPNSSAIVYNKKGSTEIGSTRSEKYQTNVLFAALNKKDETSASSRFFNFLNHTYMEMKKTRELKGSVMGTTSRGENWYELFFPNDSSFIICDTIRLSLNPAGHYELIKNLLVINTSRGDTIYNSNPGAFPVTLVNLKEGEHHWSTIIKTKEGKTLMMDNVFYVPSDSKRNSLLEDLMQFREMISSFNAETQAWLLDDYLKHNKIYLNNR